MTIFYIITIDNAIFSCININKKKLIIYLNCKKKKKLQKITGRIQLEQENGCGLWGLFVYDENLQLLHRLMIYIINIY